jgi:CubicO group peptidase (beta-lactamase class C family)
VGHHEFDVMSDGGALKRLLDSGVTDRVYPAAVLEVGHRHKVLWRYATGRLTYEPDAPAASDETVFDLASLTKVIATTTLAMRLVERGSLRLSDRVSSWLHAWQGRDRAYVRVVDLLEHCAGLTSWMPFYRDCQDRADIEHAICELPLEYVPWTRAVYSDLGFLLLGFLLEDAGGAALDRQAAAVLDPDALRFGVPPEWRHRTAPTQIDPWRGRLLIGEVDDENAWALGGVAGHAGLFGTAGAVGGFARRILATCAGDTELARRDTLARFVTRSTVPRSSRAVGWDTMLPTSSCGTRLSAQAFGHTGFTGTSLWIDPARDLYVVLLTNRVHPTRDNPRLAALRPRIHDAVVEELG